MTEQNRTPEPQPTVGAQPTAGAQPTTDAQAGASTPGTTSAPAPATTSAPTRTSTPSRSRGTRHDDAAADPLRGSKASGVYAAVAALGVVLVLLIIFIAQNTQKTTVNFLVWSGHNVPVAVALLVAAAAGLFLAIVASSVRILQLRRRVKRERRAR